MKKILASSLFIAFFFAGTTALFAQNSIQLSPRQIKDVENASFNGLHGNKISLKSYRGKVVMIDFWDTWCHPCVSSMPTEDKLVRQFPKKFAVIAVAAGFNDSKSNVEKFVKAHNYKFRYAYKSNLTSILMISGIPYKVFIGPKGKFIKAQMGSYGEKIDYKNIKSIITKYSKS